MQDLTPKAQDLTPKATNLGREQLDYEITAGGDIVIVDATQIVLCDLGFSTRVSREATLQLNDSPVTDATMVARSLFQSNMTALLVERVLGIAKMRANSAAVIEGCNYGAS